LGLEECPGDRIDAIAAAAGYEHMAFIDGKALLSRFPLAGTESVALPPGGRSMLRTQIEVKGEAFSVFVAHISWDLAGDEQARVLVDHLKQEEADRQVILVGDFNDEHYSTQINILDEWLMDAATAYGWYPGQRISWPSNGFDDTEGSQLIDLIFFRRDVPALVLDAEVHEMSPLLSDHKAATATLLFPTGLNAPFGKDPFAKARDPFASFPPPDARPANLLSNPGAEEGLSGWEPFGGAMTEADRENQAPRTGAAFFTGYQQAPTPEVMRSGASQVVDLSAHAEMIDAGRARVLASAYMCTGWQAVSNGDITSNVAAPYDDAEVILGILDAEGTEIMHRSSGRRDTLGYHPWTETLDLPPGSRAARLTWASHRKELNGDGNDGIIDDIYLGIQILDETHAAVGPNLLPNPGAEAGNGDIPGWDAVGWRSYHDDELIGPWIVTIFPPWSWSGEHYFVAGAFGPYASKEAVLSATIPLDEWRPLSDAGALAIRWGGMARTFEANARITFSLTVINGDGSDWGGLETPELFATVWTSVEQRTLIPPGASALRFEVRMTTPDGKGAAFLDDLFLEPVRL
ncbi:MAG: hypothetical protein GXP54_07970, partial [Deltaproteobacteria bacterium]|nr:hypothetical protein [Deltaproteobacteria bacterium]